MLSPIVGNKTNSYNGFPNTDKVLRPDVASRDRWEAYRRDAFKAALPKLFAQRFQLSDERSEHSALPELDKTIARSLWDIRSAGDSFDAGEVA